MPPLTRSTVAADMCPTIERHPGAASGTDNHREHRLRARRGAVYRFRDRRAVSIVSQTDLPVQTHA